MFPGYKLYISQCCELLFIGMVIKSCVYNYTSSFLTTRNGVRQGYPRYFPVMLSCHLLSESNTSCYIDSCYIHHFIYADDICIFAPSPSGLQKLPNICDASGCAHFFT